VGSRAKGECVSGETPERLLTPMEVSEILSVSVAWVLDHSSRRRPYLPAIRLGKAVRFRRSDVEEFIQECSQMKGAIA
jgi:excisionase family DNA binding protein